MAISNVSRALLPTVTMALLVTCKSFAALADQPAANEKQYIEHLQEKLVKVYFPPPGPFNYADSEIKVKIEPDGQAKLENIMQPPLVHGKRSPQAELCLRSAVENVNPLEAPPKDMKLPARFSVKFIVQAKGDTVFKCVAKRL
jgi:hypothetical protein